MQHFLTRGELSLCLTEFRIQHQTRTSLYTRLLPTNTPSRECFSPLNFGKGYKDDHGNDDCV